MRKFIKGKDGKFKGSLPSAPSLPATTPQVPKLPENSTIELESGFDKDGKYVIKETPESHKRYIRILLQSE